MQPEVVLSFSLFCPFGFSWLVELLQIIHYLGKPGGGGVPAVSTPRCDGSLETRARLKYVAAMTVTGLPDLRSHN